MGVPPEHAGTTYSAPETSGRGTERKEGEEGDGKVNERREEEVQWDMGMEMEKGEGIIPRLHHLNFDPIRHVRVVAF